MENAEKEENMFYAQILTLKHQHCNSRTTRLRDHKFNDDIKLCRETINGFLYCLLFLIGVFYYVL